MVSQYLSEEEALLDGAGGGGVGGYGEVRVLEGVLGVAGQAEEGQQAGGGDVDGHGGGAAHHRQQLLGRGHPLRPRHRGRLGPGLWLGLAGRWLGGGLPVAGLLVVEGDDVVLLGEGPPPLEALAPAQRELRLLPRLQLRDEGDDVRQGPLRPPAQSHHNQHSLQGRSELYLL